MPRFVLREGSPALLALRAALGRASVLASGPSVDLNALSHAMAEGAVALRDAFAELGLPSTRLEAIVRAFDLRTPRSELERFVAGRHD
jgi:hypothetical protein